MQWQFHLKDPGATGLLVVEDCFIYSTHLKLTANTPDNRPKRPKRKRESIPIIQDFLGANSC